MSPPRDRSVRSASGFPLADHNPGIAVIVPTTGVTRAITEGLDKIETLALNVLPGS